MQGHSIEECRVLKNSEENKMKDEKLEENLNLKQT